MNVLLILFFIANDRRQIRCSFIVFWFPAHYKSLERVWKKSANLELSTWVETNILRHNNHADSEICKVWINLETYLVTFQSTHFNRASLTLPRHWTGRGVSLCFRRRCGSRKGIHRCRCASNSHDIRGHQTKGHYAQAPRTTVMGEEDEVNLNTEKDRIQSQCIFWQSPHKGRKTLRWYKLVKSVLIISTS